MTSFLPIWAVRRDITSHAFIMSSKNRPLFESKFESSSVAFLGRFPPIKA
jgi:hypothetical protein